jgi:hypothetical protein
LVTGLRTDQAHDPPPATTSNSVSARIDAASLHEQRHPA